MFSVSLEPLLKHIKHSLLRCDWGFKHRSSQGIWMSREVGSQNIYWLVVSTQIEKKSSKWESSPIFRVKIKKYLNCHHLAWHFHELFHPSETHGIFCTCHHRSCDCIALPTNGVRTGCLGFTSRCFTFENLTLTIHGTGICTYRNGWFFYGKSR